MTLVAVCAAWYVEASRRPRIHYLHIYSTRYERNYVPYDADWDRRDPKFRQNSRIATVAFLPGQPIDEVLHMHYDPEVEVIGQLQIEGELAVGQLNLFIHDPGLGLAHQQTSPVELDRLHPVEGSAKEFHFAVSAHSDPFALDYRLNLADADPEATEKRSMPE